jgi:intein/homing endonuclease
MVVDKVSNDCLNSNHNIVPKEKRPEVVKQLYQTGFSLAQISAKTGIPHESARLMLRKNCVSMRHSHPIFGIARTQLTSEVGLLLGLHAGDGRISDRWGISLHSTGINMISYVFNLAQRVLAVEPSLMTTGSTVSIRSGKTQVHRFFLHFGFVAGPKAGSVKVPQRILSCNSTEVVVAFLRGLFSADGCFSHVGRSARCVLQVSSQSLRDGFVKLAARIGYSFRSYHYTKKTGHNKLPIYIAYLGKRDSVDAWMRQVGSICDAHLDRHLRWKKLLAMQILYSG